MCHDLISPLHCSFRYGSTMAGLNPSVGYCYLIVIPLFHNFINCVLLYVCLLHCTVLSLSLRYGSTMAGLNPSIDYTAPLADRGTYNTAASSTLTDPPGMDGGTYIQSIHLLFPVVSAPVCLSHVV